MSAQIIGALRRRANVLEAEADRMSAAGIGTYVNEPGYTAGCTVASLTFLAEQFRALADDAETDAPQTGVEWE